MAFSASGYITPPERSSTPVVPDTPAKQIRNLFGHELDNPLPVTGTRYTQSDCGHHSCASSDVGDDVYVDAHKSSAASVQRRHSWAGYQSGIDRVGTLLADFNQRNKMSNAGRAVYDQKVADEVAGYLRRYYPLHETPTTPSRKPLRESRSRMFVHNDRKQQISIDSGYRSGSSPHRSKSTPPRPMLEADLADDVIDRTISSLSPDWEPTKAIGPAIVHGFGIPGHLDPFSGQRPMQASDLMPRRRRLFPGPRAFTPRVSHAVRLGEQDPLHLVEQGGTRTAPDKLWEHQRRFKQAQKERPGRFALFVGNLTADYTDYELTEQLLYHFKHFDPGAEVSVTREYSRTCIKPSAIVQMTNSPAFHDAKARLDGVALFPTDSRRMRVQESNAARHFNVVWAKYGTSPQLREVEATFSACGVLEAVIPFPGSVRVIFECYGAFLEAQEKVRTRVTGFKDFGIIEVDTPCYRRGSATGKGRGKPPYRGLTIVNESWYAESRTSIYC